MMILVSLFLCVCGPLLVAGTDSVDQTAVVNFYNGLTSPGSWVFNTALDICDNYSGWVLCSGNRIVWLDLEGLGLTGTIATDLGNISQLRKLELSSNFLSGTIPSQLASLSKLPSISLQSNNLTGTFPTWLSSMSLQEIHLDNNELTGTIPSTLDVFNLVIFNVDHNALTGTIPPIFSIMPGLRSLRLGGNGDGNVYCPRADYSTWANGIGGETDYNDGDDVSTCATCGSFCPANTYCSSINSTGIYCPTLYCQPDYIGGNANWTLTAAGSGSVGGTCHVGYAGTPTRTCNQVGLNTTGFWSSVSNFCTTTVNITIQTAAGTVDYADRTVYVGIVSSIRTYNVLIPNSGGVPSGVHTYQITGAPVSTNLTSLVLNTCSSRVLKVASVVVQILDHTYNTVYGGETKSCDTMTLPLVHA